MSKINFFEKDNHLNKFPIILLIMAILVLFCKAFIIRKENTIINTYNSINFQEVRDLSYIESIRKEIENKLDIISNIEIQGSKDYNDLLIITFSELIDKDIIVKEFICLDDVIVIKGYSNDLSILNLFKQKIINLKTFKDVSVEYSINEYRCNFQMKICLGLINDD